LIFVNLRDRYGITQLTFDPSNKKAFTIAGSLGNEFVISASGKVQKRSSSNPNMKTGEIEVLTDTIQILNKSEVPPFVIGGEITANEDLRLKYRYLDLRNDDLKENLLLRNHVLNITRNYFYRNGFIEVETPILMKSTPEGARDYLVPSRIHKGKFYALPQSPQTYKQILMVAGIDRYIQLCRCFRDEDLRADRQPEFTQIDLEMSFVTEEDVFEIVEGCMKEIWQKTKASLSRGSGGQGIELKTPFLKMTYDEVMETYGIDKPDLRYNMKIVQITDEVRNSEFSVFKNAIEQGGIVAGIKAEGLEFPRKKIDELTEYVKTFGFGGLAYLKFNNPPTPLSEREDMEVTGSVKKFFNDETLSVLKNKFSISGGDTLFMLSGEKNLVCTSLGALRIKIAEDFNLADKTKFEFLWVTGFPLFHWNEEEQRYDPEHHPFTSPMDEYLDLLDSNNREDILKIKANCYDLVLNGRELGSGSIRVHDPEVQKKIFKHIGLTDEEAKEKFGFLLEAFKYGAPPHGGAAFGFDRIVALLAGETSIKDFIAFPKTTNAMSLMDGSPGNVDEKQLKELGIKIIK
jgi:aspartyl-tRNA synthetase